MKTITPAEHVARLKARQPITVSQSRLDDGLTIIIRHKLTSSLTVDERCTVLGAIAAHLRQLADDAEGERREIAAEELAA